MAEENQSVRDCTIREAGVRVLMNTATDARFIFAQLKLRFLLDLLSRQSYFTYE
jgi:hypothetical protein